jgi:hypothetical protein
MKDRADLESALKLELIHWRNRQMKDPYAAYYLYYRETTPEHNGGIIICKDAPSNPEYKLASPERINPAASVEQNFNHIRITVLGGLPVLDY